MLRTYSPYPEKHKWPKGFGSLCPKQMPISDVEALLERAVRVEGVGDNKLWAASGRWCFCAHPSGEGPAWHGFPVIGGEVDERVLTALEGAGLINAKERRRLRAQRELPVEWP